MPRCTRDILTLAHSPRRSIHSFKKKNPYDIFVTCSFACTLSYMAAVAACSCVTVAVLGITAWVYECLCVWACGSHGFTHRPESSSGLIWFPHSWLMWNSSPDVAEITTPCCVCGGVVAVQENKHNGTIFSAHRPTLMNQASSTETELPVLSVSRHQITSTKHVASIVHVLWCGTLGYITYLGEIMCEKWNTC